MALVLDPTVGGASSNSYVSLADANNYFEGRPFADAWNAATTPQKEQALVYATSLLDRERWAGTKGISTTAGFTQRLAWPRRWAPSLEFDAWPDYPSAADFIDTTTAFYSSLDIPKAIKDATCELALEILRAGTTDLLTLDTTRNIKRQSIAGVIDIEYFDAQYRARGIALYPTVLALIAPLLRVAEGPSVERV